MFKAKKGHNPDYIFVSCVALLAIFGFLALSSASSDLAKIKFNDTYFYLKHQFFYGLIFGIIGFFIASNFYYQNLKKIAIPFLLINIILLVLVFTPLGFANKGAARWLHIGSFSFQPAEFLKLSFIIYIAAWLGGKKFGSQKGSSDFTEIFFPFVAVSGLIAALILAQPATTIFMIIMVSVLIIYFVSGARISHFLGFIFLGLAVLSLVVYSSPYRYQRVASYFDKSAESNATTRYQLNQSLTAIGSGGLFGIGFGKSTIKYKYLPESIGDSIFSVIAEEFGFLGAIFLISVFLVLFYRGLLIAQKSGDAFGRLLSIGFVSIIAIQVFIHIAANSGLLPLTGVPLPFISYGGTALAVFLTMMGIVVNISKYT
ncbi:cell division protein FtsW [Candidatus Wolfebacteria bacterium]|nr:cell division protein FtsW [Candidatus Wolfebacteria bacterium]